MRTENEILDDDWYLAVELPTDKNTLVHLFFMPIYCGAGAGFLAFLLSSILTGMDFEFVGAGFVLGLIFGVLYTMISYTMVYSMTKGKVSLSFLKMLRGKLAIFLVFGWSLGGFVGIIVAFLDQLNSTYNEAFFKWFLGGFGIGGIFRVFFFTIFSLGYLYWLLKWHWYAEEMRLKQAIELAEEE